MSLLDRIKDKVFIITFLIGCIITLLLTGIYDKKALDIKQNEAKHTLETYREKIENVMQRYIDKTNTMESVILSQQGTISYELFTELAQRISEEDSSIISVQYIADTAYVYPKDYEEVNLAIEDLTLDSEQVEISAPVTLSQEQRGMIVRNPVYLEESTLQLTGAIYIILDISTVLNTSEFHLLEEQGYAYCLTSIQEEEEVVVSQQATDNYEKEAIYEVFTVGNHTWKLSMYPIRGWISQSIVLGYILAGVIFSFLIGLALSNRKYRKMMVDMIETDDKMLRLAISIGKVEVFQYSFTTKEVTFTSDGREIQDLAKKVLNAPESLADEIVYPQSRQAFLKMYYEVASGKESSSCVIKVKMGDSGYAWERITLVNVAYEKGTLDNIVGVIEDITEEKESEENLKKEKVMRDVMKGNCEVYIEANLTQNKLLVVNDEVAPFKHQMAQAYDAYIKQYIDEMIYTEDIEKVRHFTAKETLEEAFYKKGLHTFTLEYRCLDVGVYRWELAQIYLTKLKDDLHVMIVVHDNQKNKEKELMLRYQAETDMLTGLYNRGALEYKIETYVSQTTSPYALWIVDLDHFKSINDQMGHMQGDYVLQDVANVLREHFSSSDLIGRLGGDEFVVLMKHVEEQTQLIDVANRLVNALDRVYTKDDISIAISASIGICVANQPTSFQTLYGNADKVLYDVKQTTKNGFSICECVVE